MKKKLIGIIILIIIISVCIINEKYGDNKVKEKMQESQKNKQNQEIQHTENTEINITNNENNNQIQENIITNNKENSESKKEYPKENIDYTYKGYDVCAKLEIPKITLETNILSNYSEAALSVSVVKFWGVDPNKEGNFCIVGHNYLKKNMFHNLKKLKIGDTFFITDREIGKVQYKIFSINQVEPEDVSCLDAVNNEVKEVTLITCTSDSKKRIIIKAHEN